MPSIEIVAATSDISAAQEAASSVRGQLFIDNREHAKVPFRALVTAVTDDITPLEEIADFGLYVVCRRTIKAGTAGAYSLSPMIHHPDKTHKECDTHWRDVHAPLALVHHAYMTHYAQLSVIRKLQGTDMDGFAFCGFATADDIRDRFFTTKESVPVILADIQNFADTKNSPKPLIAVPAHVH